LTSKVHADKNYNKNIFLIIIKTINMDKSLISELNTIREEIISLNYEKAKEELRSKVKGNPLKTEFILFESEQLEFEMAKEISKRLSENNKCDTTVNSRFFSSLASILVKLPLQKEAKIEEVKEEIKTEEVKTEEVKTEEVKEEVKTEEVKTEEVKTEEVKTEEVKTEEVKTEEVKTE